ncbi:TPA: hypothetical protein GRI77_19700 [Vibrio parahaemolyticus]|uniref:hypothetical protein n=1 Tax=Vibrio parahaemolyticus TaxID=670 RepID=UPI0007A0DD45|nr:hypothetical protein [Vibrio parahaemolyticus]EGQ9353228.1 hypothetical protein [Vibrio parahaemolyticus]EGQ9515696.1 hypothetical protein [Vibrio parahaemolyticus]EIM7931156.1 hypothetical protein [Vibrio parahaemolyticus]EJQ8019127.1 hypothetical protein [Vibrio parahaemolyticus]EJU8977722.1 hypothetical protein [Vibrio parahaemolyticus]
MRPTANTLTFNEYLAESRALDSARKWLRASTKKSGKVVNKGLKQVLDRVLASLFEPSETTKLSRQIDNYTTTLLASFEELQSLAKEVNDNIEEPVNTKRLKILSIETRQLANQFLRVVDDYRRSTTKGGKLTRSGKIDLKLYTKSIRVLEEIERLCNHTSKASAFIAIDNKEAASKQLQPIIKAKL